MRGHALDSLDKKSRHGQLPWRVQNENSSCSSLKPHRTMANFLSPRSFAVLPGIRQNRNGSFFLTMTLLAPSSVRGSAEPKRRCIGCSLLPDSRSRMTAERYLLVANSSRNLFHSSSVSFAGLYGSRMRTLLFLMAVGTLCHNKICMSLDKKTPPLGGVFCNFLGKKLSLSEPSEMEACLHFRANAGETRTKSDYATTLVTTPAPTVLPPSRIAKRC